MEYDLNRFKRAQQTDAPAALEEIRSGRKGSHWIWYIFPQLQGLGRSSTSDYYGIRGAAEARAYLADPELSAHLREISRALLRLDSNSPRAVMGVPDDKKLCSSMTLFAAVAEDNRVFLEVPDKYFGGRQDRKTLYLLGRLRTAPTLTSPARRAIIPQYPRQHGGLEYETMHGFR